MPAIRVTPVKVTSRKTFTVNFFALESKKAMKERQKGPLWRLPEDC